MPGKRQISASPLLVSYQCIYNHKWLKNNPGKYVNIKSLNYGDYFINVPTCTSIQVSPPTPSHSQIHIHTNTSVHAHTHTLTNDLVEHPVVWSSTVLVRGTDKSQSSIAELPSVAFILAFFVIQIDVVGHTILSQTKPAKLLPGLQSTQYRQTNQNKTHKFSSLLYT